ncbi:Sterol carrier protein domain-containing protein [Haladaptatus litoreus]|uniref:Sterol carrier protein domain-containing protein n=1 Tax=Haladaptatus litoreus TaxID=553468 RepID=A0A1N7DG51_9EURY|nr:GNAT family N-acetyltransferase [Haladaptatus litoreus]SIR74788.1 Sterol carrier protein domain-containing protein [Haladaptatus litoreus]
MTDIDGPRFATTEEFPEMMELLDRYFSYEQGGMAARLPYSYDCSRIDNHAIIRVDGQIISHVGAFPQTLVIGDEKIECWGFGGVATHRRHRGNGYMSQLLEFWFDRMEEQGVPLAELSGNRQRYSHFGWEAAGREFQYKIHDRSFSGTDLDPDRIATYTGSDEQLTFLRGLHSEEIYRVKRSLEESCTVFGQRGLETLLYMHDDDAAYVSLSRESRSRTISEFGGSERGIETLLAYIFGSYDINNLKVVTPPRHPLNTTFRRHSRVWSLNNHRNVKICDLEATLDRFSGQMERRWKTFDVEGDGTLTLGIQDTDDAVRISYSQNHVETNAVTDEPELQLTRQDMVALLFGFHDRQRELKDRYPFLAAVMPLEFFIWKTEQV